jgi:hypothetical protein
MQNHDPIDYDAIIREAKILRAQHIANMGHALASFFRRKRVAKPLLG